MKIPELEIGKRLTVGANPIPVTCFGIGPSEIRGTAAIQGPVIIGASQSYPIPNAPEASLMLARTTNPEAPAVPSILKVTSRGFPPTPIDVMIGDPAGPVGFTAFCGPMPFVVQATAIELVTLVNYSLISPTRFETGVSEDIGAKVFTGTKIELGSDTNVALAFNNSPIIGDAPFNSPDFWTKATSLNETFAIAKSKKGFDIPHPTKKDYRLRYICVEGPSAEVYLRGKLKNKNIIELPEYWKNLVDIETIGVTLTPIGYYQELFVEKIEWGTKIIIKNNFGSAINCDYTVFAERKDTCKNIPEYKGLTPADYPGDNSEYVINGESYS